MAFVLDASVAVAWVVPTQGTPYARRLRTRAKREPFHVPAIFASEVANALVSLERRRILSEEGAAIAARVMSRLEPIVHAPSSSIAELRDLALRFGLSGYDASYLALAIELKLPVACGDRPLKAALPRAGLKLA